MYEFEDRVHAMLQECEYLESSTALLGSLPEEKCHDTNYAVILSLTKIEQNLNSGMEEFMRYSPECPWQDAAEVISRRVRRACTAESGRNAAVGLQSLILKVIPPMKRELKLVLLKVSAV